jgi:hypothetical protein
MQSLAGGDDNPAKGYFYHQRDGVADRPVFFLIKPGKIH